MGKRLANVLLITLAIALSCVFIFALVLFLAPGLSVFGVKYIASGTHVVSDTFFISDKMPDEVFSGSVRIEAEQVPISVVFTQKYTYQLQYYDNYNGLTTSKIDDPSIEFSKDNDGTAVIKVKSFKKFIYENNNSSRFIRLLIPSTVVGGTKAGQTSLTIVSKSSPVSFADETTDNYDPYFRNLSIETSGKITSSTKITADNYSLKTINAIKITEDEIANINATNYVLNSTGGKIIVDRPVVGDINATTKNARIQILSCRNFIANSGYGDVYSAREDIPIKISGAANIKTTAGIVEIDTISGTTEKSVISTKTGNVKLTNVQDLDLTTTRGFVRVISGRKLNVTTSSGSITVETATESVTATSKRGKITLGGAANKLYNPTVTSTFGDVSVVSASGTVSITTINADVNFVNNDASNISLTVGGELSATKLLGAVTITVDGNSEIEFSNFTQESTITGTSAGSMMSVKLLNNVGSTFSYDMEANDVSLWEYNDEDPENNYQVSKSTSVTSSPDKAGKPLLTIKTPGKLVAYYKKTV